MKLDNIEAIIKVSDLSFLQEPHLRRFSGFVEAALLWLTKNTPGHVCLDVRACAHFSSKLDVSFFVLDDSGGAAIMRRPLRTIYFLEKSFGGKKIAFNLGGFGAWCDRNRFSFDWTVNKEADGLLTVEDIDLKSFGLKLYNRFYIGEEIAPHE
jgi:hypothetical protein